VENPPPSIAGEKGPAEKRSVVIVVGAGKGGTGKTTFAINLGVALAEMGHNTILMDADASMSDLSTYIGMDPRSLKATLHEVLAGEATPDKAIYRAFNDHLRVVPSGLSIEGFLKMDRSLLKDVIEYFSLDADFIVIDTPAGYNKELALSLAASDHLILVLNPDEGSMTDGLKVQEMAKILNVNVLGIVLNRYDMKNSFFSRPQVEARFGSPVIAMLPEEPGVRRKDRVPPVLADPSGKMASETYHVAEMLSGKKVPVGNKSFVSRLMLALFNSAGI
jgi:septum site-determining protein MinD